MSTIEATVSIMEGMSEDARDKVLEFARSLFAAKKTKTPFVPLSEDQILEELAESRQQIANGEGIPAEVAMERMGKMHGFI